MTHLYNLDHSDELIPPVPLLEEILKRHTQQTLYFDLRTEAGQEWLTALCTDLVTETVTHVIRQIKFGDPQ